VHRSGEEPRTQLGDGLRVRHIDVVARERGTAEAPRDELPAVWLAAPREPSGRPRPRRSARGHRSRATSLTRVLSATGSDIARGLSFCAGGPRFAGRRARRPAGDLKISSSLEPRSPDFWVQKGIWVRNIDSKTGIGTAVFDTRANAEAAGEAVAKAASPGRGPTDHNRRRIRGRRRSVRTSQRVLDLA
jgi:hypothetical protein